MAEGIDDLIKDIDDVLGNKEEPQTKEGEVKDETDTLISEIESFLSPQQPAEEKPKEEIPKAVAPEKPKEELPKAVPSALPAPTPVKEQEVDLSKPSNIVLSVIGEKDEADLTPADRDLIKTLDAADLNDFSNTRPDISLDDDQQRMLFKYQRESSPYKKIPTNWEEWYNLGAAASEDLADVGVMTADLLGSVLKGTAKAVEYGAPALLGMTSEYAEALAAEKLLPEDKKAEIENWRKRAWQIANTPVKGGEEQNPDAYTDAKYLAKIKENLTPEQIAGIEKDFAEKRLKAKQVPFSYTSELASLPESVAFTGTKVASGGMQLWDNASEKFGLQDEETSFQRYKARREVDTAQAKLSKAEPRTWARVMDTYYAPVLKSFSSLTHPSVKEYMIMYPELSSYEAASKREADIENNVIAVVDDVKKSIPETDPDMAAFGSVTIPGQFGVDVFGYAYSVVQASKMLTPIAKLQFKKLGLSDDEINNLEKTAQEVLKKKELSRLEGLKKPRLIERAAGATARGIEKTGDYLERSQTWQAITRAAPAVTGATIGYQVNPENPFAGLGLGALGGVGAKYGVKTLVDVPKVIKEVQAARRISAGGSAGPLATLKSIAKQQDEVKTLTTKLKTLAEGTDEYIETKKALDVAKSRVKDEGIVDYEGIGKVSDTTKNILRFVGDDTIANIGEYARLGIEPTLVGLATGIIDSSDEEELKTMIAQGLVFSLGGRAVQQGYHKFVGEDPVIQMRKAKQANMDALKAYRDSTPETRGEIDKLTDWDLVINRQAKKVADTEAEVQRLVNESPDNKKIEEAEKRLEAEKKSLSLLKTANVQTRNEFGRQFLNQLGRNNALLNGTLRAGQNNVGINILTTQQIFDHFRKNPQWQNVPDEVLMEYASQQGFYSGTGGTEFRPGVNVSDAARSMTFDPSKPSIVINSDALRDRIELFGETPIDALNHETGHAILRIKEIQDAVADASKLLFTNEITDASGNVKEITTGLYSEEQLNSLFKDQYLKNRSKDEIARLGTGLGLWDANTNSLNKKKVARYMQEEILAELFSNTLSRNLGKNIDSKQIHLLDIARLKLKNKLFKNAVTKMLGFGMDKDVFSKATGATLTPDAQSASRNALRILESINGDITTIAEQPEVAPISKADIRKSKIAAERYGMDSGLFATKVQAQVFDADGNPVGDAVDVTDPSVFEGSWRISKDGEERLSGYGQIPLELRQLQVPEGGTLSIKKKIITEVDGVTPKLLKPSDLRKIKKDRAELFKQAIDTPDYGTPGRFEPVSEGSESYRGTFTPAQIKAIQELPEGIVPLKIKKYLLELNEAIVRRDGTRFFVDYAAVMDDNGNYKAFSPKIYDVVPIGLQLSTAGNFLVTTISVGRMMSKLSAWSDRMPNRLSPWNGSKEAFWNEFSTKYLDNWSKGIQGSGYNERGEAIGSNQLSDDVAVAEQKKSIFNDFLNLFKNETEVLNLDRTKIPKRKGDEKNKSIDRTIMSMRIDHMAELLDAQDLPKLPIDYGKALINFLPAETAEIENVVRAGQLQFMPERPVDQVAAEQGFNVKAYHGTSRSDRVGNRFRKTRATSGPMAFFTSDPNIAENYSKGKADTSIEPPEDYRDWFKFKPAGSKKEVNISDAWYSLTPEQRRNATEKLYTTGYENADEGTGAIIPNAEFSIAGKDSIDYELRKARGNALEAAKELWLTSGTLFNDEVKFTEVLKSLGVDARFDDPFAKNPKVYDVFLKIQNPLVTSEIPENVMDALRANAKKQRKPSRQFGADAWDKRTVDAKDWISELDADYSAGRNSFAWTRIPDWVTDTLKSFGYDSIHDTGGKMGGEGHDVYIPFEENQIKSAAQETFTDAGKKIPMEKRFSEKPDIRFMPAEVDTRFADLEAKAKAGDKKAEAEAQRMVDEVAKEAVYKIKAYRGASFDYLPEDKYSFAPDETYFTQSKSEAEFHKNKFKDDTGREGKLYEVYIKSKKPYIVEDYEDIESWNFSEAVPELKKQGYDSVGYKEKGKFLSIVPFYSENIKSADPFTYDDAGNLIPLSQRFQTATPDIRFLPAEQGAEPEGLQGIELPTQYRRISDMIPPLRDVEPPVRAKAMLPDMELEPTISEKPIQSSDIITSAKPAPDAVIKPFSNALVSSAGLINFLPAYHGTPFDVDKFSTEKIGTGEGAQAYGWGLYFAQARKVGEQYRDELSGYDELTIFTDKGKKKGQQLDDLDLEVAKYLESGARSAGQFKHNTVYYAKQAAERDGKQDVVARIDEYGRDAKVTYEKNLGNLYKVDLDVKDEDLLDWDKPLSEQSEKLKAVNKALQAVTGQKEYFQAWAENFTGSWLYHATAKIISSATSKTEDFSRTASTNEFKLASEALAKAGIPGIRYLDGGSRSVNATDERLLELAEKNNGNKEAAVDEFMRSVYDTPKAKEKMRNNLLRNFPERTYNYVIFDENLIKILDKNDKPVQDELPKQTPLAKGENFEVSKSGDVFVDDLTKPLKFTQNISLQFLPASPEVNLEDYIDKPIIALTADRMGVGKAYVGPEEAKKEVSQKSQGGPGFSFLYTDEKSNPVWGFTRKEDADRFVGRVTSVANKEKTDSVLVAPTLLSPDNHLHNPTGQLAYAEAIDAAIKAKFLDAKLANSHIEQIMQRVSAGKGLPKEDKDKFSAIKTLSAFVNAVKAKEINFRQAALIREKAAGKTLPIGVDDMTRMGILPSEVAKNLAHKGFYDLPTFSVVSLFEVPANSKPEKGEYHYSYPWIVRGKSIGFLKNIYNLDKLTSATNVRSKTTGELSAQPVMVVMPQLDPEKIQKASSALKDLKKSEKPLSNLQFLPQQIEEKIIETAVKNKDGSIISYPNKNHAMIMEETDYNLDAGEFPPMENFGFITNTGRFVNQKEAQEIAKKSKQVEGNQQISGELVSRQNIAFLPEQIDSSTSVKSLTENENYKDAKYNGNPMFAYNLAKKFLTDEVITSVNSKINPEEPAIIIPVSAIEGEDLNTIPLAVADILSWKLNIPVSVDIVKTSKQHNTGASAQDRASNIHSWAGKKPKEGTQIILVDDTYTTGQTLRSLADYVGEPTAIVTLASGRYGKKFDLPIELEKKLLDKAGITKEDFISNYGKEPNAVLTGAQAQQYLLNGAKGKEGLFSRFPSRLGKAKTRSDSQLQDAGRNRRVDTEEYIGLNFLPSDKDSEYAKQLEFAFPKGPKTLTYFSGIGTWEQGLKGEIDPQYAVEYDPAKAAAYRAANGDHMIEGDVTQIDPKRFIGIEYFHASPVCKNYSLLKDPTRGGEENDLDIRSADAVNRVLETCKPKFFTLENVGGYKKSDAYASIKKTLTDLGYKFDEAIYKANEYGSPTDRKRLLLRATLSGELPAPIKKQGGNWYDTIEDIVNDLPDAPLKGANFIWRELNKVGIDPENVPYPILIAGGGSFQQVPWRSPDEPAYTFTTNQNNLDRILLPGGISKRVTGRAKARMSGFSDDFILPDNDRLANIVIGNGVPPDLVKNVIGPMFEDK